MLLSLWCVLTGGGRAQSTLPVQNDRLLKAQRAERGALATHDTTALADAYYQYGRTYIFAGDYRRSQGYFWKAVRLLEPRGDSFGLSRLYVRISENEGRLSCYSDGLRYARQAQTIAQRAHSSRGLGLAYNALACTYSNSWQQSPARFPAAFDSALYYYRRKEPIYLALNDTLGIAETALELGTLLTHVKHAEALPKLKRALFLIDGLHRDRQKVNVLIHLAAAYRVFGQLGLALQTLQQADRLYVANRADEYDTLLGIETEYVSYYQAAGEWQQAFRHQEKRNQLERNQLLTDRDATIAQLNVAYETEKKEAMLRAQTNQLSLRTQHLQTQQRLTLATSMLLVVALGMSVVFFRLYRKNQRIRRQNEALVKEQNHRVKNNLQLVSSLLNMQAKRLPDDATRRVVEESRLRIESMAILHRRLYDGDPMALLRLDEFIPELVDGVLRTYGCQAVRTRYVINEGAIAADKAVPLGLLLNELTTNACKHAFADHSAPELRIECQQRDRILHLQVTDNGSGNGRSGHDRPGHDRPGHDRPSYERLSICGSNSQRPRTFGLQLIQAQAQQLNATYRFATNGGCEFSLTCNL